MSAASLSRLRPAPTFPVLRWVGLAWIAVYAPSYARAYGFANFLFLCNVSVLLTALGLWRGSALLLSSQAVGDLVVSLVWTVDFLSRFLTGTHFIGGTEYMWEPRWPLPTRLLSLYHMALPVILVTSLRRTGYDRRGLWLQSAIAVAGVLLGRLLGPEANINNAFVDPIFKRSWQPAALHLAIVTGALVLVAYPLTHLALQRLMPAATCERT
jgi:hypothetical protein